MEDSGICSLIIKGENLNFKKIEKVIGIESTQKFEKGKIVSKVIGKIEFDLIRFDIKVDKGESPNNALNKLADTILESKDFLKKNKDVYDIYLNCYIQSDYAQVNYVISSEVIKKISLLDLNLKISLLSWGGAELD